MKVAILVVALLALAAVAMAAAPTDAPTGGNEVRWGKWRIQRLHGKVGEHNNEVQSRKSELGLAKAWAHKYCVVSKRIRHRVAFRKHVTVNFWKKIVAIRKDQLAFHQTRRGVHNTSHRYAKWGPKGVCKDASSAACAAWKAANPAAARRWRHAHAEYVKGGYGHHRNRQHGRLGAAKRRLASARKHLRAARKRFHSFKSHDKKAAKHCRKHTHKVVARFTKAVANARGRRAHAKAQIVSTRAQRAAREATYKPVFMTACKHLGIIGKHSGRHQSYRCHLNANLANQASVQMKNCKQRPRKAGDAETFLRFTCWK